jgi:hypothetical protein
MVDIVLEQRNNAVHYDITLDKGATYSLPLRFLQPSSSINPELVPINLSGYTGFAPIKDGFNNVNIMAQFTITFSGSNPSTGSVDSSGSLTLSLLSSQTKPLEGGIRGVYSLFMYPNQDTTLAERWLEGEVWVRPS